jgi:hypothetical protein
MTASTKHRDGRRSFRQMFWIGAAAILAVAAAIAIAAVVAGELSDTDAKILATLGVLFLAGSAMLAALALLDRGQLLPAVRAIVVASPVAFAVVVAGIWTDALGRGVVTALLVLAGELVVATNRLLVQSSRLLVVFAATCTALAVAEGVTLALVWTEAEGAQYAKLATAFWILTALGYFLTPLLQRAQAAKPTPARTIATVDAAELVATRDPQAGDVVVAYDRGRLVVRTAEADTRLERGEVIAVTRRRSPGAPAL